MKSVSGNKIVAKAYKSRQAKGVVVFTMYEAGNFRRLKSIRRAKQLLASNKYA